MALRTVDVHADTKPGGRPLVVFVPGLGGVPPGWSALERTFAPRFDVTVADHMNLDERALHREHGVSPTLEAYADELWDWVESLTAANVIGLIGQSFGAWICLYAAARRPDRVAALVASAPPVPDSYVRAAFHVLRHLRGVLPRRQFDQIARLVTDRRVSAFTTDAIDALPIEESTSDRQHDDTTAYARKIGAMLAADLAVLASVTAPVRLLAGGHDAIAPPSKVCKIGRQLHDAEIVVMADAAHSLLDECSNIYGDLAVAHFVRHWPG
jgi:pimeloyl-ACP methyl ester carboxylesterase